MKTVLIHFKGPAGQRDQAEKRLCAQLPGCPLTPTSGGRLEARLSEEQLVGLAELSDWAVTPVVWADVNPPRVNLDRMRAKLGSGR